MATPTEPSKDSADLRVSVDMSVKLSTQLMATAVGVLTVEGALFAFVLTYRQPSYWFFVLGFLAAIILIVSMFYGGKGITIARNKGFEGKWDLQSSKTPFNRQALGGLLGLVFLILTLTFGLFSPLKVDSLTLELGRLRAELNTIEENQKIDEERNRAELISQQKEIEKLRLLRPCLISRRK